LTRGESKNMKKLLTLNQKSAVKFAGLSSIATALVAFAINKLIDTQLNFWMLIVLLVIGIGTFIYLDLRKNKNTP